MKLVLDTCVLFPTVMREMLLGCARQGAFEPLWSTQILGEWQHTAAKLGPVGAVQGQSEIAFARAAFPKACVAVSEAQMARFWLPDAGDIHVLAAAVLGHADGIVTLNNKDFPAQILAEEGVSRVNPDALLLGFLQAQPDLVASVAQTVLAQANAMGKDDWTLRSLMKKARLPRLGKALAQGQAC